TAGLTKTVANTTVILNGMNTYGGGTTVSAGTLQGNTNSLQGSIANFDTVVFDQPSDGTYGGTMSGTGTLIKQNLGGLELTANNTYSGLTQIKGGILVASTSAKIGDASPTNGVALSGGGTLKATGAINSPARNITVGLGGGRLDVAMG